MAAIIRRVDPTSDVDLEATVAVRNTVTPDDPTSVEEIRGRAATYPGSVRLLAIDDGRPVGSATTGRMFMRPPDFDAYWGWVGVLPEHRRRGVGGTLLREIARIARDAGKRALHGPVSTARPEGIEFATHRGFHEEARHKMVRLDLEGLEPPPVEPPPGIQITNLADRPDLVEGVHAVALEGFADIPAGETPMAAGDLAEFRARDVDWPAIPKDAFMVAVDLETGRVVGYASLTFPPGVSHHAFHDMTAVGRVWRGRGVASALKRATIGWAVGHGLEYLETDNDEANAAMRSINARLGYRPQPDYLTMRGLVADILADGS